MIKFPVLEQVVYIFEISRGVIRVIPRHLPVIVVAYSSRGNGCLEVGGRVKLELEKEGDKHFAEAFRSQKHCLTAVAKSANNL